MVELQPNLLDGSNQHLLQHHQLLEQIPVTTTTTRTPAESSDNIGNGGGGGGMIRGRESMDPLGDEFESRSGSENVDGEGVETEQDPNQRPRKKRYHRHTQHQIQEMEAYVLYSIHRSLPPHFS